MEFIKSLRRKDTGKAVGIISYFTIIGWLFAYFVFHRHERTAPGSYQMRQTLLLHIVVMVLMCGLPFILSAIWTSVCIFSPCYFMRLLGIAFFVLRIVGLGGAINSEKNRYHARVKGHKVCFRLF